MTGSPQIAGWQPSALTLGRFGCVNPSARDHPVHFHDPLAFSISPATVLGGQVCALGFSRFDVLAAHVRALPCGHAARPGDSLAVLREARGTNSSKHHLLATVAQTCGHPEVVLTVGIYAMSELNTPGIGSILESASVSSIPQAHCYLTVDNQRLDFTGLQRGSASPLRSLSAEFFLTPDKLAERRSPLQQQAVAHWATQQGMSFEAAWALRQACLAVLTDGLD